MNLISKLISRILYGSRYTNGTFIEYLKRKGVQIGENTVFYEPTTNIVDVQNPKLLILGDNVRITAGVKILTHDYSWSVITGVYGECVGGVAPVKIGNNVFIGIDSIITAGVTVGDNVIIGAGSVVTKDCDSNSVYAGVPAKKIMSLEDFYHKRKKVAAERIQEIENIVGTSQEAKNKYLREYAFFDDDVITDKEKLMRDTGYYDKAYEFYFHDDKRG
ncbi:MAG: acyltransferase [Gemmiger sp.]